MGKNVCRVLNGAENKSKFHTVCCSFSEVCRGTTKRDGRNKIKCILLRKEEPAIVALLIVVPGILYDRDRKEARLAKTYVPVEWPAVCQSVGSWLFE